MAVPLTDRQITQAVVDAHLNKKLSELTVGEHLALLRVIDEHLPHMLHTPRGADLDLLLRDKRSRWESLREWFDEIGQHFLTH
jgi:hypothetical protein